MVIPYDILLLLSLPQPLDLATLEESAEKMHLELKDKYPNTIENSHIYATKTGVLTASYSDLLRKYNILKSYIETLK